jgi:ATP-dependent Clp protease protease subunit
MGAIKVHHTATDDKSAWDGPAQVAAAPNEEATLRYMHTWVDDQGDPAAKNSYKFPHHDAGTDTPANIAGVNNALARIEQANIPDGDRAGVESHLRAHRIDAGLQDSLPTTGRVKNHEPLRCFEGSAKPHEPFWRFKNAADDDPSEPEMELYGYISEYSWFDDDITPKLFKDDLYKFGNGGPITIRMNSYGGDVIAASVMRSIIQDYPGKVTVRIDGIAASAATVVATAGDLVMMQDTAYYMIHDPMVFLFMAALNIDDLGGLLDEMKSVKKGIVAAYQDRTRLSLERISKLMTNETWMSAQEAVDMGFADEIIGGKNNKKVKAISQPTPAVAMVNALRNYRNLPASLLSLLEQSAPDVQPENPVSTQAAERLRAEVKILK